MTHRSLQQTRTIRPGQRRTRISSLFLLLGLLVLCGGSSPVEDGGHLEQNGIRIQSAPSLESLSRDLVRIYPVVREELRLTFGWDLSGAPTVRLISDADQFHQWMRSPLTVAFAVPGENLVVLDATRLTAHPFSLRDTFKHELCHLLLHQQIHGDLLPRWLDEGIAQWASDGANEILMDQKRSVLNRVVLTGNLIPLDALARGFPGNDRDLILAYEQSRGFVDYLIKRSGPDGVLRLLRELKQGTDVPDAFFRVYGVSLNQLERDWHRSLKGGITWVAYVSYHLYEILFLLAALMSIYGFIRIMVRKRRRMKEEVDIEELRN